MSFKELQNFFERWVHRILPERVEEELSLRYDQKKKNYFLIFLKIQPPIFFVIFILTLFYDPMDGISIILPWKEKPLMLEGFLRMIVVTGLVGYGTNYIAIKMLFHPRKKRPILGQGLIPASKIKIAYKLGEAITREVINHELIFQQLKNSGIIKKYFERLNFSLNEVIHLKEFQQDLIQLIEHYVNTILHSEEFRETIKEFIKNLNFDNLPAFEGNIIKFYKFIKGDDEIANSIEKIISKIDFHLENDSNIIIKNLQKLPEFIRQNEESIEYALLYSIVFIIEKINLRKIIVQNLLSFDEIRLEKLLLYSTSDQLQYIQYLGAFLGFLGGLFVYFPYESLILFLILGVIIVSLDILIFKLKNNDSY